MKPTKKVLEKQLSFGITYVSLAKTYKVSDTCIKKWAKSYGIKLERRIKYNGHNYKNRKEKYCINCGEELTGKPNKYCDHKCYWQHIQSEKIRLWKNDPEYKLDTRRIRDYLLEKYKYKCCKCGWNKTNKHTGNVPLELHHKDGNSENNREKNLQILCPNCHSLTKTAKGANIGNGRHYRRQRYLEGKSY